MDIDKAVAAGCVIAAFDDRVEAERAVDDLHGAGFGHDEIGFALRGEDAVSGGTITDAVGAKDGIGAVEGAVAGSVLGALLAAAVTLLVPGVGPVVAGGIIAAAAGGAFAGASTGGILGALAGLGASEEEARHFEREFRSGKALVAVRATGREALACEIIRRHGGRTAQLRGDDK
ncbi:MAG: hypothetical protein JWL69_1934 [Phycisphaerales bacterium]|nr:hypothetical protein [Phycisphaerales bacterium]MDB5354207.1 hypothetical protein [Phycisphaerales bacterium]